MFEITIESGYLMVEEPHSLLERTLFAEYLFSRGYLVSDLKNYPYQMANRLMREACSFAEIKSTEIEYKDIFQRKFRLPIFLN